MSPYTLKLQRRGKWGRYLKKEKKEVKERNQRENKNLPSLFIVHLLCSRCFISVIFNSQYKPPGSPYCPHVRDEEIETWRSYVNSPKSYSNDNNNNRKLIIASTITDYPISALPFNNKPWFCLAAWYAQLNIYNSLCDHILAKEMQAKVHGEDYFFSIIRLLFKEGLSPGEYIQPNLAFPGPQEAGLFQPLDLEP